MNKLVWTLLADESAQDLIEYALLASLIALVGALGFQLIGPNMKNVYESWDSAQQQRWDLNESLPPSPTP